MMRVPEKRESHMIDTRDPILHHKIPKIKKKKSIKISNKSVLQMSKQHLHIQDRQREKKISRKINLAICHHMKNSIEKMMKKREENFQFENEN
jgi:hypothetical protein